MTSAPNARYAMSHGTNDDGNGARRITAMARLVTPGDLVELPRPDCDGEEHAHPSRSVGTVVYTAIGGWLSGWEERYLDSRRSRVGWCIKGALPAVVVAWDRIVTDLIHEHANYGLLTWHFETPRFVAPPGLMPSPQRRLLAVDDSQDRACAVARKVVKLGRPSKDPEAAVQVGLFD